MAGIGSLFALSVGGEYSDYKLKTYKRSMNLEQIIKRQEEGFERITNPYCINNSLCTLSQIKDKEKILNWHTQAIKEILEVVRQEISESKSNFFCDYHELCEECCGEHCCEYGYNEAKSDTINYLEKIIKSLNN